MIIRINLDLFSKSFCSLFMTGPSKVDESTESWFSIELKKVVRRTLAFLGFNSLQFVFIYSSFDV